MDVTASNGEGNSGKPSKAKRHGVGEFWCHKIDANGNIQWQRYFGGTNNDRSYDAIQTREGNFLIVGTTESNDVDVKNPKGSYDVWVVMVSPFGDMIWENSFLPKIKNDLHNRLLKCPDCFFSTILCKSHR